MTDRVAVPAISLKRNSRLSRPIAVIPEDAWFAWLNERWERIPPSKIVADFAPDGQAYLFVMHVGDKTNWAASGYDLVLCFVRPKGGL